MTAPVELAGRLWRPVCIWHPDEFGALRIWPGFLVKIYLSPYPGDPDPIYLRGVFMNEWSWRLPSDQVWLRDMKPSLTTRLVDVERKKEVRDIPAWLHRLAEAPR